MAESSDVVVRRSEEWLTLQVQGPYARAFVHRLSTGPVDPLEPGATRLTAFVDKRGRMRALTLVRGTEDGLTLLGPGSAPALLEWLDAFGERRTSRWSPAR